MKELLVKKIEELEEMNKNSRKFCETLDDSKRQDKKLMKMEFDMRVTRNYAIMVLEELLEKEGE